MRTRLATFAILALACLLSTIDAETRTPPSITASQQTIRYNFEYKCAGETVVIGHCRSDSDRPGMPTTRPEENYCQVYYPDWPKRNGFTAMASELRSDLVRQLQACGVLATSQPASTATTPQAGTAVLSVVSGFQAQPGAVDPLVGKTLVLFKEGFENFMRRTKMFEGPPGSPTKASPLAVWAHACTTQSPMCQQALYEMRPNTVSEVKMVSNGRATLPAVPAGSYYLFAVTAYNKQVLVWDLRVDLKPGASAVTLDQRNTAPLDGSQRSITSAGGAAPPESGTTAAKTTEIPAAARPSGQKNSILNLQAIAESRQPMPRTTFYLLDDDFESILKKAGFKPQMLLGQQLPLLNSFELVKRWKALKETNPMFSIFETMSGGESVLPDDIEQQYAIGMKALSEHTVVMIKTNIYGKANFPSVPAGAYYVYGTSNEFVSTGARGTFTGNTVTLNDTGYQKATIWNLKVAVKPGQNSVALTPDNAAFEGN